MVQLDGQLPVPYKWSHFKRHIVDGEPLANKIKREFWVSNHRSTLSLEFFKQCTDVWWVGVCVQDFFTCEEGKEARAAVVQDEVCKQRLKDMYHYVRIQAIRTYYANFQGESLQKPQIRHVKSRRETDLTHEQYMQVIN